ncbi:MAG: ParB N-terminal domain-containing protein [Ruminococcus sp.]|nr:ParB N-terminal domain-containing protein [Ruminococcus sp.]
MAKKFTIDTSIAADIKSAASDSFKDSIRMIELKKIKPSMDNFYSLSDIEILADDIERQGLKHNIVVVEDSKNRGTYFIKSGHRRFTAIQRLVNENRYNSKYIPCFVDGIKSKSETILDLIMLNATTRVMTDSELFKQYEILKDTLDNLKHEGVKIKGRLREKVAEMLNVSPAQVGKIENIKHNAVPEIIEAVESGDMTIATADSIAKLPEQEQKEIIAETPVEEITTKAVKEHKEKTEKKAKKKTEEKIVTDDDILLMEIPDEDYLEEKNDTDIFSDDESDSLNKNESEEEKYISESVKNEMELMNWAMSLSKEQIAYLCNGGWYNNTIKGYLISAAKKADFSNEQIKLLLNGVRFALSELDKNDADNVYVNENY